MILDNNFLLTEDLQALWLFNEEDSGNYDVASDYSGHGRTLTRVEAGDHHMLGTLEGFSFEGGPTNQPNNGSRFGLTSTPAEIAGGPFTCCWIMKDTSSAFTPGFSRSGNTFLNVGFDYTDGSTLHGPSIVYSMNIGYGRAWELTNPVDFHDDGWHFFALSGNSLSTPSTFTLRIDKQNQVVERDFLTDTFGIESGEVPGTFGNFQFPFGRSIGITPEYAMCSLHMRILNAAEKDVMADFFKKAVSSRPIILSY